MAQREPEPARLQEFIFNHYSYELEMLGSTHGFLALDHGRIINNALIESFCLHARNLIDFYRGKQGFLPSYFTTTPYKPKHVAANTGDIGNGLFEKLNQQIVHLTRGRTTDQAEKIGPDERERIFDALVSETRRFVEMLDNAYRAVDGPTIRVGDAGPSASSEVSDAAFTVAPK